MNDQRLQSFIFIRLIKWQPEKLIDRDRHQTVLIPNLKENSLIASAWVDLRKTGIFTDKWCLTSDSYWTVFNDRAKATTVDPKFSERYKMRCAICVHTASQRESLHLMLCVSDGTHPGEKVPCRMTSSTAHYRHLWLSRGEADGLSALQPALPHWQQTAY